MNDLKTALAAVGLTEDDILDHVGAHDCAILVGSVAEGYANSTSDIDVIVLTSSAAAALEFSGSPSDMPADADEAARLENNEVLTKYGVHIQRSLSNGRKLQIQMLHENVITDLKKSLLATLQWVALYETDRMAALANPNGIMIVEEEEFKLLHRVYNGLTVRGQARLDAVRSPIDQPKLSQCLLICKTIWFGSNVFDLVGLYRKDPVKHIEAQIFVASDVMIHLIGMVLAVNGITNVSRKLQFRLLEDERGRIGAPIVDLLLLQYRSLFQGGTFDALHVERSINTVLDYISDRSAFVADLRKSALNFSLEDK